MKLIGNDMNFEELVMDMTDPIYTKPMGRSLEANIFYNFLNDFKVDKEMNNEFKYNIITRSPNGIYNVPEDKFNEFCELLNVCSEQVIVGETQNISGLKFDFDVKLKESYDKPKGYMPIINRIYSIILNHTNYSSITNDDLYMLFQKKPKPIYNDNGYFKDGFHLIFPSLKLSKNHKRCLVDFINNDPEYNFIISKFYGDNLCCKTNDVLDKMVCSNPIMFPGCKSKPENKAYKICCVYKYINGVNDIKWINNIKIFKNIIKEFSLNFNGDKINKELVFSVNTNIVDLYSPKNINNYINLNKFETNDDKIKEIKELLMLLDYSRYNYEDWNSILISIINHTNGDENAYSVFDNWCKDGKNYDNCQNRCMWDDYVKKLNNGIKYNYSIGTIKYFAKIDSPDKYELLKIKNKVDYNKLYNEENYYWQDFLNDMNKTFDNLDLLIAEFKKNIKKVLILVHSQNDALFRKINPNCLLNYEKKQLKATFKYYEEIKIKNKKSNKDVIKNKLKKIKIKTILEDLGGYNYIPNYDELDFKPFTHFYPISKDYSKRNFNSWSGFQSKLLNKEDIDISKIDMILNHIKDVWANGNDIYYDYILAWFKNIFTQPQLKSKVAIVLRSSEKQVGKGIIINDFLIPYVFGNKMSMSIAGLNPIVSRFNSIMMNKLFINADELSTLSGNYHTTFDTLLKRITDPTINIEIKGGKSFIYPDYSNYIMCTNNNFTLKINEGDSRYFLTECSAKYKGDYNYFEALVNSFNQETANHFYSYICYYNTNINDIRNIPMTQLKYSLMKQSFQNPIHYLISIRNIEYEEPNIKASLFYRKYKDWCNTCNEKPLSNTKFGRCIASYINKFKSGHMFYELDSINLPFIIEEFEIQETQI